LSCTDRIAYTWFYTSHSTLLRNHFIQLAKSVDILMPELKTLKLQAKTFIHKIIAK
jgi:hypothetical protein